MMTISLCMIVKNEEEVLARCLGSVKDAVDEIVILDTGSTDRTKEIALAFTPHVHDFEWIDDFSAARNRAFSYATMDFIMWLDADDVLLKEDLERLLAYKRGFDDSADCIMMRYNTGFDANGNVTMSFFRERLFRRSTNPTWLEPVHEVIAPFGRTTYLEIAVTHRKERPGEPGRNLRIYEKQLKEGKKLSARGMYYYARELNDLRRDDEAIAQFKAFLDSGQGWYVDSVEACVLMARCYERKGMRKERLNALLDSMYYDNPKARVLCEIGRWFVEGGQHERAVFWYEQALLATKPVHGFIHPDDLCFTPHIQLCVCYDRMGDLEKAMEHNELAAQCKPDSSAVEHNRRYFQQKQAKGA